MKDYKSSILTLLLVAGGAVFAATLYQNLSVNSPGRALADTVKTTKSAFVDSTYRADILNGDKYFQSKDYLNAKAYYQLAIDAKPQDTYARGKLKETMDLLRSMKATNILYDVAIANAEKLFQQREYDKAIAEFTNAGKILPNEKYPKERINAIIKIMVDEQTREEMYSQSITSADKSYNTKAWQSALLSYQKASGYKPDEQYPKERISELTKLLAELKVRDEAYKKSIAAADKLFDGASYDPSKSEYENSSKIKPEEAYPVNRIKEIDQILARLRNAREEYERLVDKADSFYMDKKYNLAKINYQQALQIKPGEAYPKDMISKADNLIAGQEANSKALEDSYQAALTDADKYFSSKDYDKAKTAYQGALGIKPDEQYPKDKLREIEALYAELDKQKTFEKQYADLISAGDKMMDDKSYGQARVQYQSALKLKPGEKYPKDRITEIDAAMGDMAKQKALDDQYSAIIIRADRSFAAKTWEIARKDYTSASNLKPNETYPKDKINEIERIVEGIAAAKVADEQYKAILANADKLLLSKTYNEARVEYQKAIDSRPDDSYPRNKISDIDKALGAIEARKSLDEKYSGLIDRSDKFLADKAYEEAKAGYQEASGLKPAESYPKEKITAINLTLAEIARKKALNDQYDALVAAADKLMGDKSYSPARVQYQSALKLKPTEKYPADRIGEIDIALSDLAKQKALDDQYSAAISKADKSFASKNWEGARTDYSAASGLKPNELYPKDKIAEIEKMVADLAAAKALDDKYNGIIAGADKLLASKDYAEARAGYVKAGDLKQSEDYPKQKISEIDKTLADIEAQKSLDEKYKSSIDKADKLLSGKSYDQALSEYNNALSIKPAESYPKTKIAEVKSALDAIAAKRALDEQYTGLITEGDRLLHDKSYDKAKESYRKAGTLKPDERYPKDQISAIDLTLGNIEKERAALEQKYRAAISAADKLMENKTYDPAKSGYGEASAMKPEEQYPKDKIIQIDKILADIAHQKETDAQYKASISKGDELFSGKKYDESKSEFKSASGLKPDEQYPKTRIAAIDKILDDARAFEDKYNGAIATGDTAFNNKSFTQAKAAYQIALQMKPSEKYPKSRIDEIGKITEEMARQKVVDDQYQASVTKADKLLADKSYAQARTEYGNASTTKPREQYPKDKISEIDATLADIKAKDEAYKNSITKANQLLAQKLYEDARSEYQSAGEIKPGEQYPKDKIEEINKVLMELKGRKQTFDELVSKGNDLLSIRDFYKARDYYQQALSILPEETFPKERLIRVNSVIDSIFRANKVFYDKAVADGDKFFNSLDYDKAIDSYTEANGYLPAEQYPKDMIAKIKKAIADNAIVDVMNGSVVLANGVEKQFTFPPVNIISRKNNYLYIKIKNLSNRPFSVMLRYGQDKQINGGAVIKNITGDGKLNERLISVKEQDPWYRNDNNWISLYPQGGDVEVSFIQISRSGQ